jgi:hypothetical protein
MKITSVLISVLFSFCIIIGQVIGRQDVVGYTTYDWQFGGPVYTCCRTAAICNGIHVCWLSSAGNPAVDRNQGYNYYDFATRQWHWPATGINVFTIRSGFGNLDYDPITGVAVLSTQQSAAGGTRPVVVRDQAIGAGLYEYCYGPLGWQWPPISVSYNQAIHCAMIDSASTDSLWYSRVQPWCTWSTPINICPPATSPMFPCHNLAASKISNKVVILWQCSEDPYPERAYYRISNDGGLNWEPATQLPFPPPLPGLIPSFNISSLFAMFDNQDNLHVVASVSDTGVTVPAAIWHFCPINNPQWSLIYYYAPETLAGPVGYNAIFATRPTIVQSPNTNYFYVSWEQFDSLNYEPLTNLARADIWIAESPNNGQTWRNQRPITMPNTTSKRYPCVGGVFADTLVVSYLIDSIAGAESFVQGRTTRNPVICHFIPVILLGTEEQFIPDLLYNTISTSPNPFTKNVTIRFSIPAQSNASLEIYDVTGRLVKFFNAVSGELSAESQVIWDGRDNQGKDVKNGIYFCTLRIKDKNIQTKIVLYR